MNILLLVPTYHNLYKPIESALIDKGHNVITVFDEILPNDPYLTTSKLRHIYNNIIYKIYNVHESYWKKYIKVHKELRGIKFDMLFCINGYSLSPFLIDYLKQNNNQLKTVLYLWDSNKYYYFERHLPYFNLVYSFDLDDSLNINKVKFLPFYWIPFNAQKTIYNKNKYKISIIGTNHDGRFYIVDKIANILDLYGFIYYFKIIKRSINYSLKDIIKLSYYELIGDNKKSFDLKLQYGKIRSKLFAEGHIPQEEVLQIMYESEYILDTDRESQTGTTPRLIWALSLNKKIITTNKNIKRFPFYNEKQIFVIDRDNPNIDFILNENTNTTIENVFNNNVENLRIDLWIENFLKN